MKTRNYGLYSVALAILVVGALWGKVSVGTLALLGLGLVCALMMIFMVHGGEDGGAKHRRDPTDRDLAGRDVADRLSPHDHTMPR